MGERFEKKINQSTAALIDILHDAHIDNARLQYYAKNHNREFSIMPHTPFVYEYFLFNSLYQINWDEAHRKGIPVRSQEHDEFSKQRSFISYLVKRAKIIDPAYIYRAFEPLLYIEIEEDWKHVKPDALISKEDGEEFFARIDEIKNILSRCRTPSVISINDATFPLLRDCARFVYDVRNNIFHGAKTLGDICEPNQKKRIEIYDIFLKGLTSLFFLVSRKDVAACDYIPCPVYFSYPDVGRKQVMDRETILDAVSKRMMKVTDSRLVAQFFQQVSSTYTTNHLSERSSLFCPSVYREFVASILLGLPYCTQFYFYEINIGNQYSQQIVRKETLLHLSDIIYKIVGDRQDADLYHSVKGNVDCLDFEYNRVHRRVHLIHDDNMDIFNRDIDLKFYFHRCGSRVEGGSRQKWDSKYIHELQKLIPSGSSAFYVTDEEPGEFKNGSSSETFKITASFLERGRTYYCGKLYSL